MITAVFLITGFVGAIVFALLLIFRRELVGVDLSARSLVRLYLYVASLAAVIVFAIGVSRALDWGTASALGAEAVYGRPPTTVVCPVGEKCPDPAQLEQQYLHEREQQQAQDLIAGVTVTVFGAIFWAAHRFGRRVLAEPDERTSALRRAYLALGTFVFGISAMVLIPFGAYQALSAVLLRPGTDVYKPGIGDSLWGGIVALPIWIYCLVRIARDVRSTGEPESLRAGLAPSTAAREARRGG